MKIVLHINKVLFKFLIIIYFGLGAFTKKCALLRLFSAKSTSLLWATGIAKYIASGHFSWS